MAILRESLNSDGSHYAWLFMCPACKAPHACDKRWGFNGNQEKPTFDGSVLIHPEPSIGRPLCHSHVRDGQIQYGNDCTHEFAGKTVPLPEFGWDIFDEKRADK